MRLNDWLKSLKRGLVRSISRKARRRRLWPEAARAAEVLEDRTLLSTFIVNSTEDKIDAMQGDGAALTDDGDTTLRAAIMEVRALGGEHRIELPPGTFTLTLVGAGEDSAVTGDLDILGAELTIRGDGMDRTIIDGNRIDRVFEIGSFSNVTMMDLTIRGGRSAVTGFADPGGGGIKNRGSLTLQNVRVTDNEDRTVRGGGGIAVQGGADLTLIDSIVDENLDLGESENAAISATDFAHGKPERPGAPTIEMIRSRIIDHQGGAASFVGSGSGGIFIRGETGQRNAILVITDSTVSGNLSGRDGFGGALPSGILSFETVVSVSGSTVSGNSPGAGVFLHNSRGTFSNSTISGNGNSLDIDAGITATSGSTVDLIHTTVVNNGRAGLRLDGATANVHNSILANNSLFEDVVFDFRNGGLFNSLGHNLIESAFFSSGTVTGDTASNIRDQDPRLGPLQDNGGPTFTHALLDGSPAIDAGDPIDFAATDQRGVTRPQDAAADIGAFEFGAAGPAPLDDLTLPAAGNFTLVISGGAIQLVDANGTVVGEQTLADDTPIVINGLDNEDDTLVLDFSGGNPIPAGGITFNGGDGGNDALELQGGSFGLATFDYINANDGSIDLDGSMITYTGLEPVLTDFDPGTDVLFNLPGTGDVFELRDLGGGQSQLFSNNGTFEHTSFTNPGAGGFVTINMGGGADSMTITSLDPAFAASLIVDGQTGTDLLQVNTSLTLGGGVDYAAEQINLNGASITTGNDQIYRDPVELQMDTTLTSNNNGNIEFHSTVDGDGNGPWDLAVNTGGNTDFGDGGADYVGNTFALDTLTTDAAGQARFQIDSAADSVTTVGNQTYRDAVILRADTRFVSNNNGTIEFQKTVDGDGAGPWDLSLDTGGNIDFQDSVGAAAELGSIAILNTPVDVTFQATIETIEAGGKTGDVTQTNGTGTTTLSGGIIAGNLDIQTNSVHFATGTTLDVTKTVVINAATDITQTQAVVKTSGANGITYRAARSIAVANKSSITTVNGVITLEANRQAAATSGTFVGIDVADSLIATGGAADPGGNIALRGRGGNAGNANRGVRVHDGAAVRSQGSGATAGTIEIDGIGGGADDSEGATIVDAGTVVTSVDGAISISGESTATGTGGHGVAVVGDALIESTGTGAEAATITIAGTAGADASSDGFLIDGPTTEVSTVVAAIDISAAGGDLGMENAAVIVSDEGNITLSSEEDVRLTVVNADADAAAPAGTVIVTADSDTNGTGGVLDNLAGETANVTGGAVAFRAAEGIGSADDIDTAVAFLAAANTTTGDIVISNSTGELLTIDTVDGLPGVSNAAANGAIEIAQGSPLTVNAPIVNNAGGNVALTASDDAVAPEPDDLTILADITLSGGNGMLTLSGENIIQNNAAVSTAGTGAVDYTATRSISIINMSSITTENGAIALSANAGGGASGTFTGITIDDSPISTGDAVNAGGNILLEGTGGDAGNGNRGVVISGGSAVASQGSGAAAGTITIDGTGRGVDNGEGVVISGTGTTVTSVDGAITIDGGSQGTGQFVRGVAISNGAMVSSTGTTAADAATIEISGTAGNGTSSYEGVLITDLNTAVTSVLGDVSIDGVAGSGAGSGAVGVLVQNQAAVSSTGTGADAAMITINGMGGAGTNGDDGVRISSAAVITSVDGDVSVTGEATATGTNSDGVQVSGGATIESTGSADVTLTGLGNNAAGSNGVLITGANTRVRATDGAVLITSVDTANAGDDILIGTSAEIESTNSTVTLRSGDDLTVQDQVVITAGDTLTMLGDFGAVNPGVGADAGVGSTIQILGANGAITAGGGTIINGNNDDDVITLQRSPADVSLSIDGRVGNDEINIDTDLDVSDFITVIRGRINISGSLIMSVNAQTWHQATPEADEFVVLENDVRFTSTMGNITFHSTIDAADNAVAGADFGLTTNTITGENLFLGAVGTGAVAGSDPDGIEFLTTDDPAEVLTPAGTTDINGGTIVTTEDQTYNDDVILTADTTLVGNDITFQRSVNSDAGGPWSLTVNTIDSTVNPGVAGVTIFNGTVGLGANGIFENGGGDDRPLASLTTNANGRTEINGGEVFTTGDQTYNDPVTLGADTTLHGTNVFFNGTLDSDAGNNRTLTVNADQVTRFGDESADFVGGNDPLASITTDTAGTTEIVTTNVFLDGTSATFNDPVILRNDVTIDEAGAGDVTFNNTVDTATGLAAGLGDLTLNVHGGGETFFNDRVGTGAAGSGPAGTQTGLGSGVGPAITIQAGDTTFNTDLVRVRGDVRIEGDDIILSGQGKAATELELVVTAMSDVVTVAADADRVTVRDMEVIREAGTSGNGIVASNVEDLSIINIDAHDHTGDGFRGTALELTTTVTNSDFTDNGSDGMELTGANIVDAILNVTNSTASGNTLDGLNAMTFSTVTISGSSFNGNKDDGIDADNIEALTISDSSANNNSEHGIEASNIGTLTINQETEALENGGDGLNAVNVGTLIIDDSVFNQNKNDGLDATNVTGTVTISDSSFNENEEDGVQLTNVNAGALAVGLISDSLVQENRENGIHYVMVNRTEIQSNTITNNQQDGIFIESGTGNRISQNETYLNGNPNGKFLAIDLKGGAAELGNGVTLNDKFSVFNTILLEYLEKTATVLKVDSVAGLPAGGFLIVVDNEVMRVTSVNFAAKTLMVDRGFGGTLPVNHRFGSRVLVMPENSDSDAGPNNLQNTPEILYSYIDTHTADPYDDQLHIIYHVPTSTTQANYSAGLTVEFFLADFLPSGVSLAGTDGREGATFFGSHTYVAAQAMTSAEAVFNLKSFTPEIKKLLDMKSVRELQTLVRIVATATDADGNTSEFSRAGVINAQPGIESAVGRVMTSLPAAISAATNTFQVNNAAALQAAAGGNRAFKIQIDNEEMLVTAVSGNTITVLRGLSDTMKMEHPAGALAVSLADERPRTEIIDPLDTAGFIFTPGPVNPEPQEIPDLVYNWSIAGDGLNAGLPEAWFDDEFGIYRVENEEGSFFVGTPDELKPSFSSGYADEALRGPAGDAQVIRERSTNSTGMISRRRLTSAITAASTKLTIDKIKDADDRPLIPDAPFEIIIDNEQMLVTKVNSVTRELTVTRGIRMSEPAGHAANAIIRILRGSEEHSYSSAERIAFYLVQNATAFDLLSNPASPKFNPTNAPINQFFDGKSVAFFSFQGANPDGNFHIRSKLEKADDKLAGADGLTDNGDFTGALNIYWEDLFDPSDFDFGFRDGEDAVVSIIDPFVKPVLAKALDCDGSCLIAAGHYSPDLKPVDDQVMSVAAETLEVTLSASDPEGDPLSYSANLLADPLEQKAYDLDQVYGFTEDALFTANNYYEGARGMGEKYFRGAGGGAFYILPNGEVYRWVGGPTMSTLVTVLDGSYHADPERLIDAKPPALPEVTLSTAPTQTGATLTIDPAAGFEGSFLVQAVVSDGILSDAEVFQVTVTNLAPVLSPVGNVTILHSAGSASVALSATDTEGDPLKFSAEIIVDAPAKAAYDLDQAHGFFAGASFVNNNYYHNARGRGEKYFLGGGGKAYFVLPDGSVYRWGSSLDNSTWLATLDERFHRDVTLLTDAQPVVVSDAQVSLNRSQSDRDSMLSIKPEAGFLGTFDVLVTVSDGSQSDSEMISVSVVNHAPVLVPIGNRTMSAADDTLEIPLSAGNADGDPLAYSAEVLVDPTAQLARDLDQAHGFFADAAFTGNNYYYNARGLGEKYFQGSGGKAYFILPDGSLYRWGGSIARSALVGRLNPDYHDNPDLLIDAQPAVLPNVNVSVTGSNPTKLIIDPADGFLGTFAVKVTVSDGIASDSETIEVTVESLENLNLLFASSPDDAWWDGE